MSRLITILLKCITFAGLITIVAILVTSFIMTRR